VSAGGTGSDRRWLAAPPPRPHFGIDVLAAQTSSEMKWRSGSAAQSPTPKQRGALTLAPLGRRRASCIHLRRARDGAAGRIYPGEHPRSSSSCEAAGCSPRSAIIAPGRVVIASSTSGPGPRICRATWWRRSAFCVAHPSTSCKCCRWWSLVGGRPDLERGPGTPSHFLSPTSACTRQGCAEGAGPSHRPAAGSIVGARSCHMVDEDIGHTGELDDSIDTAGSALGGLGTNLILSPCRR